MSPDWCDLCELPLSQCPHGAPAATPAPSRPASPSRAARKPRAAASTSPRATRRSAPPVTTRAPAQPRTPPGRSPQTEFRRHLLRVLADEVGPVDRDEALAALADRMPLTDADRGLTADGELRWRRAALRERQAMASEGLLDNEGHGRWVLTPAGRVAADAAASDPPTPPTD